MQQKEAIHNEMHQFVTIRYVMPLDAGQDGPPPHGTRRSWPDADGENPLIKEK